MPGHCCCWQSPAPLRLPRTLLKLLARRELRRSGLRPGGLCRGSLLGPRGRDGSGGWRGGGGGGGGGGDEGEKRKKKKKNEIVTVTRRPEAEPLDKRPITMKEIFPKEFWRI